MQGSGCTRAVRRPVIISVKFQQDADFMFYMSRDLVPAIRAEIAHQVPDGLLQFMTGDPMPFMVQGFFRGARAHGYRDPAQARV